MMGLMSSLSPSGEDVRLEVSFIYLFICSFKEYLLSAFYVPEALLDARDTTRSKTDSCPCGI